MKKFAAIMLAIMMLIVTAAYAFADAVRPGDADAVFEQGIRVRRNQITIVNLHGTWLEMGRQYGYLLS